VLVLLVTMVAMDKVMRLMAAGMHNLKTQTCMVTELMLGTPITSNLQRRSSLHNSSEAFGSLRHTATCSKALSSFVLSHVNRERWFLDSRFWLPPGKLYSRMYFEHLFTVFSHRDSSVMHWIAYFVHHIS